MVIMFMISSSTALSSIITTVLALGVVVDGEHRVRPDRIDKRKHLVWRARDRLVNSIIGKVQDAGSSMVITLKRGFKKQDAEEENGTQRLLPS